MRTFRPRVQKRPRGPINRDYVIDQINKACGYTVEYLRKQTDRKLLQLRNRIPRKGSGGALESMGRLQISRHSVKLT
jgi:hypothetical protein